MKRNVIIGASAILVLLVVYFVVKGNRDSDVADIFVTVEKGKFQVDIETTGELEAKNSVVIYGPRNLREFRIHQVKIDQIVEEGTEVKKGDWIATLDRSELINKIQDAELEVESEQSQYTQTKLDTTLQMRQARDELINLKYDIEEKQIILDQSKFEPPATIKQNEINLEKSKRAYNQASENYDIKKKQNVAKMQEVSTSLRKAKNELASLESVMSQFTIIAPEDGMLIYRKGWDGKPMKEGSTISSWDPGVATLPDLSVMISKTYVNEVDVRKIKVGQKVEVGLDAFPDKELKGTVIKVANVGEQRPNSDAKVFQVNIQIEGRDDLFRPSMTTSNKIIVSIEDSVKFVPLECLHSKNDSITYVFKREGLSIIKQEVEVGENNMNAVIIKNGIEEGDRLYLSVPEGYEDEPISLLATMDGKRNIKRGEVVEEKAAEKTVTLPDGRVITIPSDGRAPGGRGMRPMGGNKKATTSKKDSVK
ncbi:MAG: efflux RND transporter periplasmic adaptor subunit [Cyclobacteriaceae bacterium]|nr:efflux RND transporter periplasmic adaptor subunit [Cyclobacteriaceae bacterium]